MPSNNNSKIHYRLALDSDIPQLQAIELAAAEIFSDEDLPHHLKNKATSDDHFKKAIKANQCIALMVDTIMAGFCLTGIVNDNIHLFEISVHPRYSRQGLGKALLTYVLARASEDGYENVTLTTFVHLSWNGPFYQKNDFNRILDENLSSALKDILDHERSLGLKNRAAFCRRIGRDVPAVCSKGRAERTSGLCY